MNLTLLANDIASRVPVMAQDSVINNAQLIQGLIETELERQDSFDEYVKWFVSRQQRNDLWSRMIRTAEL